MAATAALYRNRGAAGVRAIKGPFFIFTLLCLVGIASSLYNKEQLVKLKKHLRKAQEHMDLLNALHESEMDIVSLFHDEYMSYLYSMAAFRRKDFPSIDGRLLILKGYMEKAETNLYEKNKVLGGRIEYFEQLLRESWQNFKILEEQQAEL